MDIRLPILHLATWTEAEAPALPAPWGWAEQACGAPDVSVLAPLLRRRLGALARGMLHGALRCHPAGGDLRMVFASRHGDVARTLEILSDLAAGEPVSPTAFGLSVHNAPAGLLSIAQGNRAGLSALAAGEATLGWGLAEAYAAWCADPERPLLFVYGDVPLPSLLSAFEEEGAGACSLALLLGSGAPAELRLSWEACGETEARPMAAAFLESLRAAGGAGAWKGGGQAWSWHVA